MKSRVLTAVVLVPGLLAVLFIAPKVMTAIVFALLCAIAAFEMLFNTRLVKHKRMTVYAMVSALLVPLWSYWGENAVWGQIGLAIFVSLMFVEIMLSGMELPLEKTVVCFFAGIVVPYMLSSIVRIIAMDNGRHFVIVPFVVGFLSDTGAYFIGCKYGRHKLAPTISPKKSVEGVFGGILFAVVGMLIYGLVMQFGFQFQVNYGAVALYGLLGTGCGVFGDLCFSVIKRQTKLKDFGMIFPGHGGVLDRFDSMIFVGMVMEILLKLLPVVV